jgi:[amino group carrier protein]-L-2-aminoadipate 6-kinase
MNEEKLIVVKIGGSAGIDTDSIFDDIYSLIRDGYRIVIVHGGSERANQLGVEHGHPPQFLTSPSGHLSRYTDPQARDLFVEATTGLNADICAALGRRGSVAIGLTGESHCVINGERKQAIRAVENGRVHIIRDDYSGRIRSVNTPLLRQMINHGWVPVVPPTACSDSDGLLNIDGDRAAAAVAAALGADQMILLSNVPGLMSRYPHEDSLVHNVPRSGLEDAMGWAQGRMKRKVLSVREALDGGVNRVGLADGRYQQPLRSALSGGGTWFER